MEFTMLSLENRIANCETTRGINSLAIQNPWDVESTIGN